MLSLVKANFCDIVDIGFIFRGLLAMRQLKRLLWALRVGFLLTGGLLITACEPASEPPLSVGSNVWAGYEALYLARELNFFPNNSVALKELSSSTETLRAFRQGQLDIAALTLDEALRLSEQITDLQILLVTNISAGADKIISRSDINSIAQLKGKRVAVEEDSVGLYLLYQALQKDGLGIDEVVVLPSTVNQHLQLMQNYRADAVVTFDPTAFKLEQLGFKTLFDSTQVDGKIVDVLVSRKTLISKRPEAVKQLLDGYWQGQDALVNNTQQAYPIIARRLNVDEASLQTIYQNLLIPDEAMNDRLLAKDLAIIINETSQFLQQQGLLNSQPNARVLMGDI